MVTGNNFIKCLTVERQYQLLESIYHGFPTDAATPGIIHVLTDNFAMGFGLDDEIEVSASAAMFVQFEVAFLDSSPQLPGRIVVTSVVTNTGFDVEPCASPRLSKAIDSLAVQIAKDLRRSHRLPPLKGYGQ